MAAWCAERGIACHLDRADVGALARSRKVSKQQAARQARYAFLERAAAQVGATKIATGHTQDDRIETVLLNVLRGTGLDGLRGIPSSGGLLWRPLLNVSRVQIEAYCLEHRLTPRRDPSNQSSDYTRNKIRLDLLPQLAREYNPSVGTSLLRLSEIASRDSDYLQMVAEEKLRQVTLTRDVFRLVLNRPALASLHPALLRHVLRRATATLRGTLEGITHEHVERVCAAVSRPTSLTFLLNLPRPLCTVRVADDTLTLTLANAAAALADVSVSLTVPSTARLPATAWVVSAGFDALPGSLSLDADAVAPGALTLRNWRRGDRIDPLGMGGHHKKVSDVFTDAKLPAAERSQVPIVGDERGILWVVGFAVSERAKTTVMTTRRLFLRAERQSLLKEDITLFTANEVSERLSGHAT